MVDKKTAQLLKIANVIKERELARLATLMSEQSTHQQKLSALREERVKNTQSDISSLAHFSGAVEQWLTLNTEKQAQQAQQIKQCQTQIDAQRALAKRAFGRAQVLQGVMGSDQK